MQNPFDVLGLEPSFALPAALLEQRQRQLSRAVHPDRHAGKSPAERRQALSRAMDVNQAIRTLRDPSSRAEALFGLLGAAQPEGRAGCGADPALLMEMMERREALEAVRRAGDATRLAELKAAMAEREREVLAGLERAFAELLPASPHTGGSLSPTALSAARRHAGELRYVRRFAEEVAAIEDEL
jgi:molecular chaperone HscB